MKRFKQIVILTAILICLGSTVYAADNAIHSPERLTAEDYQQAERFLAGSVRNLASGISLWPNWLDTGEFWYRNAIAEGHEFVLVNPAKKTRERAFHHERLAKALSKELDKEITAFDLPFSTFEFSSDRRSMTFDAEDYTFTYNVRNHRLTKEKKQAGSRPSAGELSPDGKKAAFIRDYNLWARCTETGKETQLTFDGEKDFGYATNNAGWTKSSRPVLLWSPDSKMIATFQHDGRGLGEMYLTSTNVGHPELQAWKYPLPGDSAIFQIHRVVIHLDGPQIVRLDMEPDQHRSTVSDHIFYRGRFVDIQWAEDGSALAFVSSSRDHKKAVFRAADPHTGKVRAIMNETVDAFFESGRNTFNWRFLPETDELIWFSERSDWGHLYLYDLNTGALKHPITSGEWTVHQVLNLDKENRMIYFTAGGREPGDPYFQYFYSVSIDGGPVNLLTPDSSNHTVSLSPCAQYFIDAASTPVDPGRIVLRDISGKERMALETGDMSRLIAYGWQAPIPFSVKARDGETDLYGLMYRPTRFDPSKKYPVVNYLYPGPQSGSVGSRSFNPARRDNQALAELGFIVIELDAMGTPGRSKSFHEAYYGNMGDNGLPDQITGIKQLGARHPWIDLDRVGIWGHSGGGFASAAGIFRHPDFYKVAVSQAGNHDNRNYTDDWGEKWQGLLEAYEDGATNYDNQANQLVANQLEGKLLLAHGTLDDNVPFYNTLLVVDALIAANKDFDLILFPNRRHGLNEPYMIRRRWDYFVRHLLGAVPPREYPLEM